MTQPNIEVSFSNVALIKYWGKLNIEENIPTNPSLSVSLPKLKTETTIEFNDASNNDIFILNNKQTEIKKRMSDLIKYFKEICNQKAPIKIISKNNFPHSCGMASSASGYSALVKALNKFYDTDFPIEKLCDLARKGSGSACRSMFDGIVCWNRSSVTRIGQWDDLRIFNIVISNEEKKVGSTEGMVRTKETSSLFESRLKGMSAKIEIGINLVKTKQFEKLGELVMKESNQIHALCLDAYPPISYLTDESMMIIDDIFSINTKDFKAFYSFDAGPNPFIFVLNENYEKVKNYFEKKYNFEIIVCK